MREVTICYGMTRGHIAGISTQNAAGRLDSNARVGTVGRRSFPPRRDSGSRNPVTGRKHWRAVLPGNSATRGLQRDDRLLEHAGNATSESIDAGGLDAQRRYLAVMGRRLAT